MDGELVISKYGLDDAVHEGSDRWWRFSRYEVRDGCILPAPGAPLREYDPWEPYRAVEGAFRTVETPYRSLLDLGRKLESEADEDENNDIARWCDQHGLLGILPATFQQIVYNRSINTDTPESSTLSINMYNRVGGIWESRWLLAQVRNDEPDRFPPLGVVNYDWRTGTWAHGGLEETIEKFMPGYRGRAKGLPLPCTDNFWRGYGEPVELFANLAITFLRVAEAVSKGSKGEGGDNGPRSLRGGDSRWGEIRVEGASLLNTLRATTSRVVRPAADGLEEKVEFASLITMFTEMVISDIRAGRKILRCGNCGQVFISDEPRARYCSPRCRNTAQSRRYRQSKKLGS